MRVSECACDRKREKEREREIHNNLERLREVKVLFHWLALMDFGKLGQLGLPMYDAFQFQINDNNLSISIWI